MPIGSIPRMNSESKIPMLTDARLAWLFRVLWLIELILMLWWLWDECQLTYLPINTFVWYGFGYLFIALFLRMNAKGKIVATIMVAIPGVVIFLMLLFLILILVIELVDGPIRWN